MKNKHTKTEDRKVYFTLAGFIFLFIGPLIIYKPAYDYTIIKNIAGYLFVMLLSMCFIFQKKEFSFNVRVFPIFLSFAGWILLSAFYAPFGHGAAKQLEEYILYFLIFVCALNIKIEKQWVYFWLLSGIIASIIAIGQYFGRLKYPISTFGNPNFFAGHIMMLAISVFALLFADGIKKNQRWFLILFLIVSFFSLAIVKSRAAIFATFFGISTVVFLINRQGKWINKWGGYIFLVVLTAALFPQIQYWFSTNVRVYLWRGTFQMIKKNPITGWGLGNFVFFYPYFRIKEYFLQTESTPTTTHAHNEYLHLWSETGIIGLLLFLSLVGILIFLLVKSIKNKSIENVFFFGVTGALLATLIDNIFSTNLRNPSTAMYFWFLMGLTAGKLKQEQISFNISKILWYSTLFASIIMAVFTSFYRILPEVYLKRGIWAKEAGNTKEAIRNYLVVSCLNPYHYISRYKLAYVYGEIGQIEESKKVYLEIHQKIFPHFAKLDANLGTLYLRQGLYKKALYYYKTAECFNPYDIELLCSIASIYFVFYKDVPKGLSYINRVLALQPNNKYAKNVMKMLKEEGKI